MNVASLFDLARSVPPATIWCPQTATLQEPDWRLVWEDEHHPYALPLGPIGPWGKHNAANGCGHEKRPEAEPRTFDRNREVLWRRF